MRMKNNIRKLALAMALLFCLSTQARAQGVRVWAPVTYPVAVQIVDMQASKHTFAWTAQAATITNLANGIVGETNVVILPLRLPTVKAQVFGIDYISHTNQNHAFDLLICDSPITWPAYNPTNAAAANMLYTDLATAGIHKIKLNLSSDDIFGTNHIVFTNAIFSISATSYWYKVYRSAFTNAGGATLNTNLVGVHYFGN